MNTNKEWEKELDALLGRLVDTGLEPEEKARLNSIMEEHSGARRLYHQYLDVHGALEEHLAEPDFTSLDPVLNGYVSSPTGPIQASPVYWRWGLLAAALVAIGLFIKFTEPRQETKMELPIAKITGTSGPLLWTGDGGRVNRNLTTGSKLSGGTIEGMAPDAWFELEFNDGSKIVISGNSMLTISDLGQKKLRLKEGSFSAKVEPQPEDRPMMVYTRSAVLEVLGTRFSVDTELSATTLTVNEGKVRATRLSDGRTATVSAQHRVVVASVDRELLPKHVPESVTLWQSHLEKGRKRNHGEWIPANGVEPAQLKTVPLTLPARNDRKQRTIHTLSMPVSQGDHPPVVLQPETQIRVRGRIASSHRIWFGITLSRENGDFAGRFQTILSAEEFQVGEPFEVVLNLSDYKLDPSLAKWAESLPKTPYGFIVKGVWCHTLWDPAGLQVEEMAISTSTLQ